MREINTAPKTMQSAWAPKGKAIPAVNMNAPIAGPTSWLPVMNPDTIRAFATPRSALATTIGRRVDLMSAKTSAVPRKKRVTRTTTTFARPVATITARAPTIRARKMLTTITTRRRSTLSASTPT